MRYVDQHPIFFSVLIYKDEMMTESRSTLELIKYIRVSSHPDEKFVAFDFAINDPTLFVELLLPQQAFQHFCKINHVVEMSEAQKAWNDAQEDKWRYGTEPNILSPVPACADQDDQDNQS